MPRLNANSFDDPAWAIVVKGWGEYANGKFAEAIASFTTALDTFSERTPSAAIVETYICRGAALGRGGDESAAMDDFTKAIELDPQSENAFYNRGIARERLGQYGLAIEDFGRSIELRPSDQRSYIRRGVCRKRRNDVVGARCDFAEARRLIAAEKPHDQPKPERAIRLIDAPMRFPPPPGTRFYICFSVDSHVDWPPYHEMLWVIADSPQDAFEKVLREGKGPTDARLKLANVVWFNHNGRARWSSFCLSTEDVPDEPRGLLRMPPSRR